jgi:hypothetical protein
MYRDPGASVVDNTVEFEGKNTGPIGWRPTENNIHSVKNKGKMQKITSFK